MSSLAVHSINSKITESYNEQTQCCRFKCTLKTICQPARLELNVNGYLGMASGHVAPQQIRSYAPPSARSKIYSTGQAEIDLVRMNS